MPLFVIFSFCTTAIASAETVVNNADDAGAIVWDSAGLPLSPTCTDAYWQRGRSDLCIIEPSLDPTGALHLFTAERPLGPGAPADRSIGHFLLSRSEVRQLPSIPVQNAPVVALRARTAPTGELYLLWVEDQYFTPQYHKQAIYLQCYRGGVWGSRKTVLDDRAEPFVLVKDDVALLTNQDATIDVFWTDSREYHWLADLLSMGHSANFPKTYHRRLAGDAWTTVERIQRRGLFWPSVFQVLPKSQGQADVIWSDGSVFTAKVYRSARSRGRWTVEETIGRCRSSLGRPDVFQMQVAGDVGGPPKVAWVCSRYETTEPGTHKDNLFHDLYVSARVDGAWETGPILSRSASAVRWLWNGSRRSALLIQEYAAGDRYRKPRFVSLRVDTMEGNRRVATDRLSERSLEGLVEAAADADGTIHVIYAEFTSDSQAIMKYRRGKVRGT